MSFTGNEPHSITLAAAAAMTKNYRDTITSGQIIAHYFGGTAVQNVLDQETCVGVRLYYGLDENSVKQMIVVGVDANENDLYNGIILDMSFKCPQDCGAANPLNSSVTV